MNSIKTLIASICIMASVAFAGDNNGPDYNGGGGSATQGQTQGQSQGQGQLQGQAQGQAMGQGQSQGNTNIVAPSQSTSVSSRNDNTNTNLNSNKSEAASAALAGAASKSASGAIAGSNSGGNTQNVTMTDSGQLHYSGSYEVKNVPNIIMGNIHPTSPCMGSSSAGASAVGFGVSFGTSWTDDECGIRETSRSFGGLGLKADAVAILCTSKYASAASACAKPEQPIAKQTEPKAMSCYRDEIVASRMNVPVCK